MAKRMLDLFCGRFGWSRAFAARGWECVGVDMVEPPEIPEGCTFIKADILQLVASRGRVSIYEHGFRGAELWTFKPDFICGSSPCEKFSVFGQRHFHPDPPYPTEGIELFNHTRMLCEESGVDYLMENVRSAQQFVGDAVNHCGPFYLWGNAVPPLLPQGIQKGASAVQGMLRKSERNLPAAEKYALRMSRFSKNDGITYTMCKKKRAALTATIPVELASVIADYADRITEVERAVA